MHGTLTPERAVGGLEGIAWDLTWRAQAPPLPYLPARWLYDRRLPRSNGVALIPAAAMSGTVTLDGEQVVSLEGWHGMVGHNWGTEHPAQWSWLHAGGSGQNRDGWLDLVLDGDRARVTVGLDGGARLELDVTSPAQATAAWDYASPRGRGRRVRNCSVADAAIVVHTPAGRETLTLGGRFAAEHGEPDQATVMSSER